MTAFAVFLLSLFVGIKDKPIFAVGCRSPPLSIWIFQISDWQEEQTMGEKHPNRKKDKYNPYTLIISDGRYYLSFKDSRGELQTIEIDEVLYGLFNRFELEDISYLNKLSRHIEHSELTEASLNDRAFCKPESIEEKVSRNIEYELLHKAIAKLPEIQRRRLLLYFFGEMTYEQIAALEGCTKRAVKFSVDIAIEKLKKDFGIF